MNTLTCLKRMMVAAIVALSLGCMLASQPQARTHSTTVLRAETCIQVASDKKDGQETHG